MANSNRILDIAKPWIVTAIEEHGQGEPVTWELGLTAFPDPSATVLNGNSTDPSDSVGSLPALVMFLELPTKDPSVTAYAAPILAPQGLNRERVNEMVKDTLEAIRSARAKRQAELDSD
jgi:hypothetical protein